MIALQIILRPTAHGWAVYLTDGRELARFRGPGSKWRALRYLSAATKALETPRDWQPVRRVRAGKRQPGAELRRPSTPAG